MKVLIVDDEPLVRRSLVRGFQQRGHQVFEAPEGKSGLELWRSEKPDLIVLDFLMPGLKGPEVIQAFGSQKVGKVILISAFSGEYNLDTAQDVGADLFIAKPFDDIIKVIDQMERLVTELKIDEPRS